MRVRDDMSIFRGRDQRIQLQLQCQVYRWVELEKLQQVWQRMAHHFAQIPWLGNLGAGCSVFERLSVLSQEPPTSPSCSMG